MAAADDTPSSSSHPIPNNSLILNETTFSSLRKRGKRSVQKEPSNYQSAYEKLTNTIEFLNNCNLMFNIKKDAPKSLQTEAFVCYSGSKLTKPFPGFPLLSMPLIVCQIHSHTPRLDLFAETISISVAVSVSIPEDNEKGSFKYEYSPIFPQPFLTSEIYSIRFEFGKALNTCFSQFQKDIKEKTLNDYIGNGNILVQPDSHTKEKIIQNKHRSDKTTISEEEKKIFVEGKWNMLRFYTSRWTNSNTNPKEREYFKKQFKTFQTKTIAKIRAKTPDISVLDLEKIVYDKSCKKMRDIGFQDNPFTYHFSNCWDRSSDIQIGDIVQIPFNIGLTSQDNFFASWFITWHNILQWVWSPPKSSQKENVLDDSSTEEEYEASSKKLRID